MPEERREAVERARGAGREGLEAEGREGRGRGTRVVAGRVPRRGLAERWRPSQLGAGGGEGTRKGRGGTYAFSDGAKNFE